MRINCFELDIGILANFQLKITNLKFDENSLEYPPPMLTQNHDQRVEKNDAQVLAMAPYLMNERNLSVFGNLDVNLPSGVRHRVKLALNGQPPLVAQAHKLLRQGKAEEAAVLFNQCFEGGTDLHDTRFFSVLSGCASIAKQRGDLPRAIDFLKKALTAYPDAARENHYVELAQLILDHGGLNPETEAAAILQRGMHVLNIAANSNGHPSPLLTLYGKLEHANKTPRTSVMHMECSDQDDTLLSIASDVSTWAKSLLASKERP